MGCKHDGLDYCRLGYLKRNAKNRCPYHEQIKLYICGRITGDDRYYDKFLEAENELYEAGFAPINPAACVPPALDWNRAMRKALGLMLQCDGVALLDDWNNSKGAKIEANLAKAVGLPIKSIHEWEKALPH
jgi:hypothetical protein